MTTEPAYYEDFVITDEDTGQDVYEFRCNICGVNVWEAPCSEHAPTGAPGLRLAECDKGHLTWVHDRDDYGCPCPWCIIDQQAAHITELEIARDHHWRWRGWRITQWLFRKAYTLGVVVGGSVGTCNQPGHSWCRRKTNWRGKRPYVLGWPRGKWACLLRYRHWPGEPSGCGDRCGKCIPWTCCGSTGYGHTEGCPEEYWRFPAEVA